MLRLSHPHLHPQADHLLLEEDEAPRHTLTLQRQQKLRLLQVDTPHLGPLKLRLLEITPQKREAEEEEEEEKEKEEEEEEQQEEEQEQQQEEEEEEEQQEAPP
ncbi:hypothetical protein EYF80_002587 [Liparis tanakae]|uniref:Uncharacterized protein n=1 Tax=Liparis tanakae TaxID=230148 RepID=A0A4Z2JB29_9TELE|nr:hypothetical protein EYF80_002587 [Liparis tanakae]